LTDALAPAPRAPSQDRSTWAELGSAGRIASTYRDGRPEHGVNPDRLRALLAHLDATQRTGTVLSACVQIATVLPLLAETAAGSAAFAATLSGAAVTALAATDAGPGSDLTGLDTVLQPEPDGLVVTGTKRWITNATTADWLLVLARHRPGPHFTNFSWLLVPAATPGVTVEPADTGLFPGAGLGHIHLDAVALPTSAVLGRTGRGLPLFARHIAVERLAGGFWAAAVCHRALSIVRRCLAERGDLWRREVVRDRFARVLVRARQLDALAAALGPRIAEKRDHASAAMLKAAAGSTVEHVLDECAHLQGAAGFASGGLQRLRAESAVFGIAGGTTEVVLSGVADQADRLLSEFAVADRTP
jgi:alkylation response protein AidB-like acyl-CoA dehydrogenase